jgi:lambda repressor-like predicted transcriptional regulator
MTTPEDRIAELEDQLKQKERRLQELKADIDKTNDLVERMREHVQDRSDLIDSWIEAFGMELDESGNWTYAKWVSAAETWHDMYADVVRQWNRFVPEYNAKVRRRNVGRPLDATDAQRETILKLRKRGMSLRAIAEETGRGLNTVRTIVDQCHRRDRTSIKHLERIRRDMGEERTWQSRKRTRHGLPRRIAALKQQGGELLKEAKGLK